MIILLLFISLVALISLLTGAFSFLVWNYMVVSAFQAHPISFWQAYVAAFVLACLVNLFSPNVTTSKK